MWITVDKAGAITGRYNQKQPEMGCIEVAPEDLSSVPFPKWDKTKKAIVNDASAQATADAGTKAEHDYAYARARAKAYVSAFSRDPKQNAIDAIGHVLDAILSAQEGDTAALTEILKQRSSIKAANPKGAT